MVENREMEEADDRFLEIITTVIRGAHEQEDKDRVSRALLLFLVRVANTWRSIRTLRRYTPDPQGFMVDAGTLLRAMFDARFQAEFIFSDPTKREERSGLYLDFEHVERYQMKGKVLRHDNQLTDRLRSSPKRTPEAEKRLQDEYDRVKDRYLTPGNDRKPEKWYKSNLRELAKGKEAEYDTFVATYQGCVHSSALAISRGPLVKPEHVLFMASFILARVTKLNIEYNRLPMDEGDVMILDELCKSLLDRN
jgi:hypothetical protein